MESLFSLEVIVNYLKLNNLRANTESSVSCLFPTIAFRLLDYPTIAINLLDDFDAKELKSKLEVTQPFELFERLPCFTELLDKHGRYIFSKGKSCLFRSDLEQLRGHLKHAPMYLMTLDTFFEPHKLLGTTIVPLTNLIDQIFDECNENDSVDSPCTKVTHGVFEIKNLMGDEIGHVSFACRLTSFGSSLLMPHIENTTNEGIQRRMKQLKAQSSSSNLQTKKETLKEEILKENQLKSEIEVNAEQEVYLYELKKKTSEMSTATTKELITNQNALVQTVAIDYKDAQIQISDYANSNKKEKSTQSPQMNRKRYTNANNFNDQPNSFEVYQVKHVQDEFVFNHYCPPALHYNSELDKKMPTQSQQQQQQQQQVKTVINQQVLISKRIEYLSNVAEMESERFEELETEAERETNGRQVDEEESSTDEYHIMPIKQAPMTRNGEFNFDQMPLLKCLFDEMSKLKQMMEQPNQFSQKRKMSKPNSKQATYKQTVDNKPVKQQKKSIVGILRNNNKKGPELKPSNRTVKQAHKEKIIESVERLSQPKSAATTSKTKLNESKTSVNYSYTSKYQELDETPVRQASTANKPVVKKAPLKYGLTNTHRMRVLANRPDKLKEIEQKHTNLLSKLKSNMDELNLSTGTEKQLNDKIQKNMEDVLLFDSVLSGNTTSVGNEMPNQALNALNGGAKTINSSQPKMANTNGSMKSQMNFSLLNKVEIESTLNTFNTNAFSTNKLELDRQIEETEEEEQEEKKREISIHENDDHFDSIPDGLINTGGSAKMVQFGHTYIYAHHSDESSAVHKSESNSSSSETSKSKEKSASTINQNSSKNGYRNIFLENKNQYDEDFHSSLDSSATSPKHSSTTSTTASNFFTERMKQRRSSRSPRSPRKSSDKLDDLEEYLNKVQGKQSYQYDDDDDEEKEEDDDIFGEIEYIPTVRSSSKLSTHSYNMQSFIDESLGSTK